MANEDPWEKLSPKSKRNVKLAALACAIIFISGLLYVFVVIMPSLQLSYSEELTDIFYEDEFGTSDPNDLDFPTEYNYKVMVGGTTTDGYTEIRLYSQVITSTDWVLEREGYVDSDNNLYLQKYY